MTELDQCNVDIADTIKRKTWFLKCQKRNKFAIWTIFGLSLASSFAMSMVLFNSFHWFYIGCMVSHTSMYAHSLLMCKKTSTTCSRQLASLDQTLATLESTKVILEELVTSQITYYSDKTPKTA